jgi:dCMP deaminase
MIVIAYVPVLHEGYRRFFERHKDNNSRLVLVGPKIITDFKPLAKDLRALPPELMKTVIDSLDYFTSIEVADFLKLQSLNDSSIKVLMPDEDVMHELHDKHFPKANAEYDSVFLRWDKHKSFENKQISPDHVISISAFDKDVISILREEAQSSSDFWRHVGAAIIRNGEIERLAHNTHVPNELTPYFDGDPRSDFSKGLNLELSTSFHAEAALIADAARRGVSLDGTSMYVTTFPCPPCAKLVAYSGIKKLYYADGYGVLDGERVLKSQGVEIIFVNME